MMNVDDLIKKIAAIRERAEMYQGPDMPRTMRHAGVWLSEYADLLSTIQDLNKDKARMDYLHEKTKGDHACNFDNIRDVIDAEMSGKP